MVTTAFQPGSVFVETGTNLPDGVTLQTGGLTANWNSPTLEGVALKTEVEKAGWTFFFMAAEIHKHAFGFDQGNRERAALGRVIEDVQTQNCNCVEITGLVNKSFLGVPYVSITAHARHIQNGCQFHGR